MNNTLKNSIVLITGGSGTFGRAFLNRCLSSGADEVRIFSRDEKKQYEMIQAYQGQNVRFFIGDVRDKKTIDHAMEGVDYVFHAAAMKQVPLCEQFPMEAIKTNVIGSENVIDSSIEHGVKKIVLLSTDKAVYPISAMGLTKAYMEKLAIQKGLSQDKTEICVTRFNNLVSSNGSVVPLFIKQATSGKPLTVTDPDMTRFLMTVDEAMDLVEEAFYTGRNGEIFIKQTASCRIGDLAKGVYKSLDMSEDSPIVVTGARPGERKHEALMTDEEAVTATEVDDYIIVHPNNRAACGMLGRYRSNEVRIMKIDEIVKMVKVG